MTISLFEFVFDALYIHAKMLELINHKKGAGLGSNQGIKKSSLS